MCVGYAGQVAHSANARLQGGNAPVDPQEKGRARARQKGRKAMQATDPAEPPGTPSIEPFHSLWLLVFTDDPEERAELEEALEVTQAAAVDHFIEESCWRVDLPNFTGGRGTPDERRAAL